MGTRSGLTTNGDLLRSELVSITNQLSQRLRDSTVLTDANLICEVEQFTAKLIALRQNPHLVGMYKKALDK